MSDDVRIPPGWPGIPARWTSSAKSGVGCALDAVSRVWFSVSHGIINEVYYPRVDQACIRDLGLIVTDGGSFFSEEKRHAASRVSYPVPGVPAYLLVNLCNEGRYRIEKRILADPERDVVLQFTRFVPIQAARAEFHVHALLAPHLGNRGAGNTAWVGDYKGLPMLFAQREGVALALACSAPWLGRSAGFVGYSDGWQDLRRHGRLEWRYDRAENGNVALVGEIDLERCDGEFLLALAFGRTVAEAGLRARAGLGRELEDVLGLYAREWSAWQRGLIPLEEADPDAGRLYRVSVAVIRAHEDKRFSGGIIASLSVPWGFARGDDDLGGYHLAWPRDLVEAGGGLLAMGAGAEALRVLEYLRLTQEADGHWPQNMWLDGSEFWSGVQMDETALPVLLVDLAWREGVLDEAALDRFWPLVRRAASFIVRTGPVTQQDRWEEDPGYSPFTLAVQIAALLAAADLADLREEDDVGRYLRETADAWNASIERWIFASDTPLAREIGVDGYYVRIAPPEGAGAGSPLQGFVPIKNRPPDRYVASATQIVSPDALALVRFGLRAPDDSRVLSTVRVIDARLKVETPSGPAWYRYNDDGYGEHEGGGPFDGTGTGRAWPLLTGERAHYELAAGRADLARRLLRAMESFASDGGLLPEQIWDAPDIPERELYMGRPSGSAMPLVWAHAEYVKLLRSLRDGRVFDTPPQTVRRYQVDKVDTRLTLWRFNHRCGSIPAGRTLRVEILSPARVRWSADDWATVNDTPTRDTGLGIHYVELPTAPLASGTTVRFTFYWTESGVWEGQDFQVSVESE